MDAITPPKRNSMPGLLSEKNVLELLVDWHRAKRSGKIQLRRRQVDKTILMRDGAILRAQSNLENEKLGQILLKKNLVSSWDLEIALRQNIESKKRLGQVLIAMAALKEPVLNNTLVSQTRDIIFSLVEWEEGEYDLMPAEELEPEIYFDQLYTPEVILQGMRRISNIVLLLRPLGDLQGMLKLAPDYLEKIRRVTLLTEEKSILAVLNKQASLKDLIQSSGMEKLTVYRSVAALMAVDVVQQENGAISGSGKIMGSGGMQVSTSTLPATRRSVRGQKNLLGEMLVANNVVTDQQLKEALVIQQSTRDKKKQYLGGILIQLGYCTEEAIVSCLSSQLHIEEVKDIEATEDLKKAIPFHVAKRYFICPMRKHGSTLDVAMLDPTNMSALDDLSFLTSLRIQPFITTNKALREGWKKLYGYSEEKGVTRFQKTMEQRRDLSFRSFVKDEEAGEEGEFGDLEEETTFDMGELESLVSGVVEELQIVTETEDAPLTLDVEDAPVVKLVNMILRQAIKSGSSDIHIEPWENKLVVRFRMDGVLHKVFSFPISISNALISRIKIIAGMDIAERRRPQDGRVKLRMGKRRIIDHRVSVVPSVFGERVVLRVLDRTSLEIDMSKLGFDPLQLDMFKRAINQPYGMILCTGPTGSGKTTTLYSAVNSLDSGSNNIMTVEEPVEYMFPGICQVQVNEQVGVTFATVLRYFLRQDPDIILVGEIRDLETAETCCKAALTGHLVLSTVHTNDAPSAIGRLIDLGLKPYLISASMLQVIAQRLLRKICPRCKTEVEYDKNVLVDAGFTEAEAEEVTLYRGTGCEACGNTGFYGRMAIFEIMQVTRKIKAAIAADLPADQIKEIAVTEGMKDLRRAALDKVKGGISTLEEAIQNTLSDF
jgi:type IV pilus assembly protein PilB